MLNCYLAFHNIYVFSPYKKNKADDKTVTRYVCAGEGSLNLNRTVREFSLHVPPGMHCEVSKNSAQL